MSVTAYPLSWPPGWKRTSSRKYGHFGVRKASQPGGYKQLRDVTLTEAVDRVLAELERMGVRRQAVVISTNVQVRQDGLPKAGQRKPDDPGAAVYWKDGKHDRCIAVDLYTSVEDNLAAIAATLDAMRAIERHGGAAILDRAFTGFTALPAPGQTTARGWREVLGITPTETSLEVARDKYRRLAGVHHPDKGGDPAAMSELNSAWQQAQEALK